MTLADLQRLADEDLMPLVAAKDPLAFEVFYDRHGGAAFSLAYRIVGNRQAAEDVTQEALISIWRSGARFDRARGQRPRHGRWASSATAPSICCAATPAGRPSSPSTPRSCSRSGPAEDLTDVEALRRETAREVRGALSDLPDEQSRVISLAFFGGFSHSEIAKMLNEPLGTIKGRMRLGMEKIRASLAEGVRESSEHEHPSQDDLAAYALGALDGGEERSVDRARRPLRALRDRAARAHRAGGGVLAESVEQVEPPPELRQSLMATVREEAAADAGEGLGRARAPRPSGVRGFLLRPAAGLAAVALGAAGVAGYLVADGDGRGCADGAFESTVPGAGGELVLEDGSRPCEMHGMEQLAKGCRLPGLGGGLGRDQPSAAFVPRADGTATAAVPEAAGESTAADHRASRWRAARRPRPARSSSTPRSTDHRPAPIVSPRGRDLLPASQPRDRRLLLQLRPPDLPRVHDLDARSGCAAPSAPGRGRRSAPPPPWA